MDVGRKLINAIFIVFLVVSSGRALADELDCPPPISCGPCGREITHLPLPSYETTCAQPFQNYLATSLNCVRGGWSGFYIGTGFGYGAINYNLLIPGLTFIQPINNTLGANIASFEGSQKRHLNSYIVEYATLGYAHFQNRFFIAGELGYYYNSTTRPIFYEDPSTFTLVTPIAPLIIVPPILPLNTAITTVVSPGTVRLDINSRNNIAFDLLPGLALVPGLTFFGRVGAEYTEFRWSRRICFPQTFVQTVGPNSITLVNVNNPFIANTIFNNVLGGIINRRSAGIIGFRLGLGATYAVGPHLSFNANIIHITGGKATFRPRTASFATQQNIVVVGPLGQPTIGVLTTNAGTLLAANTIKVSRNEALLGLTVTF
jgi:hypothetical protein